MLEYEDGYSKIRKAVKDEFDQKTLSYQSLKGRKILCMRYESYCQIHTNIKLLKLHDFD